MHYASDSLNDAGKAGDLSFGDSTTISSPSNFNVEDFYFNVDIEQPNISQALPVLISMLK